MSSDVHPLLGPPPEEVHLPDAPLVRVIAQVRFAPILAVRTPEFIVPFQEALRASYPVLRREHTQRLAVGAEGLTTGPKRTTWRFCEVEGLWRVSLAEDFVALETTSYESRQEFLSRLELVLTAFEALVEPAQVQRLGLRYIDRVQGEAAADIASLVRPELLGLTATPLADHTQHLISEAILEMPDSEDRIRLQWGRLPARATVDPSAIEAIDEPSWILDLDMYAAVERPFSTASVLPLMRGYAERLYAVFRWAVTDAFLRRYGGEL